MAEEALEEASAISSDGLEDLMARALRPPIASTTFAILPGPSSPPPQTPQRSLFNSISQTLPPSPNVSVSNTAVGVGTNSDAPLSPNSPTSSRRTTRIASRRPTVPSWRPPSAEKEPDTSANYLESGGSRGRFEGTSVDLTRLFSHIGSSSPSRKSSYNSSSGDRKMEPYYTRASTESASLPQHLYHRGYLEGNHSDITIHAFQSSYRLHRIILDRSPFFSSALSEPWLENSAKDFSLHPEEIDGNITKAAFELALKSLYGYDIRSEEDAEAAGLLATGCWLEISELIDVSINSLLRQMNPPNLATTIQLVTSNYYGQHGERILTSAKAMLYRDGWEMPLKYWDAIPSEIVNEVISHDAFFVHGEWERWIIAVRIFNRRLRQRARSLGLLQPKSRTKQTGKSSATIPSANVETPQSEGAEMTNRHDSLYSENHIVQLSCLLNEGIHYPQFTFEQLQYVRQQRDALGRCLVSEEIISDALWKFMDLRQKIMNARDNDAELGLRVRANDVLSDVDAKLDDRVRSQDVGRKDSQTSIKEGTDNTEWNEDDYDPSRRYWIPDGDSTSFIGAGLGRSLNNRGSSSDSPIPLTSEHFLRAMGIRQDPENPGSPKVPNKSKPANFSPPDHYYSTFPPCRFSCEFPSIRLLSLKKKIYSRSVWYAGSIWNIYIQKVHTSRNPEKSLQLGVYLHRQRRGLDVDDQDDIGPSLDENLRAVHRERARFRLLHQRMRRREREMRGEVDDLDSSGENLNLEMPTDELSDSHYYVSSAPSTLRIVVGHKGDPPSESPTSDAEDAETVEELTAAGEKFPKVSALPHYVDRRPTIKTYFKIYSHSKGGRMVSVYKSAPDGFDFSRSWGWRSTALVLDDMLDGDAPGEGDEEHPGRNDKLRFSVVLGNV